MVASLLQDDLVQELNMLFAEDIFKNPKNERQALKAFPQALPIPEAGRMPEGDMDPVLIEEGLGLSDQLSEDQLFPYAIVRVEDGEIAGAEADQQINITLLFGSWDNDRNNQGNKDILHMIQKVYERFSKNPILAGRYECLGRMKWATQDENSWPYFFGGMELQFSTIAIRREDKYI